ncbi:hypothetical protein AC249_AIPGENE2588, partial [Exaiptasia diaphana]
MIPFRYMMYPGDLFWNQEGFRFSWRVMLMHKEGHATFYVRDAETGRESEINNAKFLTRTQEDQMATQPDMILQYAQILKDYYDGRKLHYGDQKFELKNPSIHAEIYIRNTQNKQLTKTTEEGAFTIHAVPGDVLELTSIGFDTLRYVVPKKKFNDLSIKMSGRYQQFEEANVIRKRLADFDVGFLPPVKGVQIYTGTNAVIELSKLNGAKSTANPREMFAKIPGLNIWESDGAGIQIGIGGRGLSPNRTANFNTRQNGYDISADALGYPESYYTPPFEALRSIEIIRGSASLQFGTQFGGLLNFIIKDAPTDTPLEFTTRNTVGTY